MSNLEDVITDAVNDAQLDSTPEVDVTESVIDTPEPDPVETAPEAVETTEEPSEGVDTSTQVPSPRGAAEPSDEPQDEFSRLAGIQQMGMGGRENRIPYTRVKKITEKAVGEVVEAVVGRKLNPGEKAIDVVKAHVAALPELQTKVADYETRLTAVGQFEEVMANDPQKFLTMLSRIPAYQNFFEFVNKALEADNNASTTPASPPVDPTADMPQPDEELPDGSKVYGMTGLQNLLNWHGAQVEQRLSKQFAEERKALEDRYNPIAEDWQERRRREAALPVIQKQIAEARTWPLFNELEGAILQELRGDPNISLDAAYRKHAFPRLIADRNKLKQDVIREAKQTPNSTAVTTRATKPNAPAAGPRSLEDVIREQVSKIK